MSLARYVRAATGRLNARRLGFSGSVPLGSRISGGRRLSIGERFFASGPVWLEAVTDYNGQRFSPRIVVGSNVRSSPRLHVSAIELISIGDWCLFGENVFIADHQHGATSGDNQASSHEPPALRALGGTRPVTIGARCHLGNNVVILPGTTLGEGCIVGANAVVSGSFDAGTILAGVPARAIKQWNDAAGRWQPLGH